MGSYQNICREVLVETLRKLGLPIVRRMSGGGTIYTDLGGWQFSFIQHKEAGEIEFQQYIAPVIGALGELGGHAEFNGRNDLTIDGKKFSGNAQYRLGDCIVHHGSLLFDTDIRQMVESTTVDSYKILSKSIKSVRDRVTNISEHLSAPMDAETFKECMVRHIMGGSDAVYGDFFSTLDGSTICAALVGCRYERSAVLEALQAHGIDGAVYRISAREMAEVIAD